MSEMVERAVAAVIKAGYNPATARDIVLIVLASTKGPVATFKEIMNDLTAGMMPGPGSVSAGRSKDGRRVLRFDGKFDDPTSRSGRCYVRFYRAEADTVMHDAQEAMRAAGFPCVVSVSNGGGSIRAVLGDVDEALK